MTKLSWFPNWQSVGWFIELERKVDAFLTVFIPKSLVFLFLLVFVVQQMLSLGRRSENISSENFETRRRFPQVGAT